MMIDMTIQTLLTSLLLFLVVSLLLLYYMCRKAALFTKWEVRILLLCVLLMAVRMLFPIEILHVTYSVYITQIYTVLCDCLRYSVFGRIPLYSILIVISLAGTIYHGSRYIWGYHRLMRTLSFGKQVDTVAVKGRFGRRVTIPVIELAHIPEPFLVGVLHPRVVMPTDAAGDRELIIRHEVTHYKHHDMIFKWILTILSIIYWWNPLIYIVKQYAENILELQVDFDVTRSLSGTEKVAYAKTLLDASKHKNKQAYGLGISSNASFLKPRICSILEVGEPVRRINFVFLAALLIMTIGINCVVLEPWHIPEPIPGEVLIETSYSYLVEKMDGTYDLYTDGELVANIMHIREDFEHLEIRQELDK